MIRPARLDEGDRAKQIGGNAELVRRSAEHPIQLLCVAGEIRIDRFDPTRECRDAQKEEERIASSAFFMKCGRRQTGCRTLST
jgi:hypothetical protein